MSIYSALVSVVWIVFLVSVVYYYMLLLIRHRKPRQTKQFKSITVIIPAHNEECYIADTLHAVLEAEFKGKKQIVVVDDGSTDRTADIVKRFKQVRLIRTKHSGKSSSLNTALKVAKGELIAVVDADSVIEYDSLRKLAVEVGRENTAAACCVVKVNNRKKLLCMWQHIEQLYSSLIRHLSSKINANVVTPGPLSVYRAELLKKLGGFSTEGYCEDIDVTIKLIRSGYRIGFVDDTASHANQPYKLKEFLRQRYRGSRGLLNILKRHFEIKPSLLNLTTMPLLLFSYVQAVVMGSLTLYQMVSGYFAYFLSQGQIFNLYVLRFFFDWFSLIGFFKWTVSVFTGSAPWTLAASVGIAATLLTYPLYIFAIFKYNRKFDIWHIVPVLFMFPYWLFMMLLYIISIPSLFTAKQHNIWKKNE
ncbi:glycosyltransferase family 2 protein [Candidatus Woesearchaeota archaeon]|nr:glycosyltransferase family 2 protein [Candidatus Woesearchaeota archaeon]